MVRPLVLFAKIIGGVLMMAAMSFTFILGHDYLTQCDYFKARKVSVEGTSRLEIHQVLHQAGVRKGTNILALNLSLARKRLLAHPRVAHASVSRELPDAIIIRIKEHVPMAVLDLGRKFIVNTKGEIFKEKGASDPENLPLVTGLSFADINVRGEMMSKPFKAVMSVLQLGRMKSSILPNRMIKRIDVDREIGLTLYAMDRMGAIKVGYNGYRDKLDKLGNVLIYLETRNRFSHLHSIDLNNLNRIVVTPAGTEQTDRKQEEA